MTALVENGLGEATRVTLVGAIRYDQDKPFNIGEISVVPRKRVLESIRF